MLRSKFRARLSRLVSSRQVEVVRIVWDVGAIGVHRAQLGEVRAGELSDVEAMKRLRRKYE